MEPNKLSGLLYIGAGIVFLISSFIGGNIVYVPLAAVLIFFGIRKLKNQE